MRSFFLINFYIVPSSNANLSLSDANDCKLILVKRKESKINLENAFCLSRCYYDVLGFLLKLKLSCFLYFFVAMAWPTNVEMYYFTNNEAYAYDIMGYIKS